MKSWIERPAICKGQSLWVTDACLKYCTVKYKRQSWRRIITERPKDLPEEGPSNPSSPSWSSKSFDPHLSPWHSRPLSPLRSSTISRPPPKDRPRTPAGVCPQALGDTETYWCSPEEWQRLCDDRSVKPVDAYEFRSTALAIPCAFSERWWTVLSYLAVWWRRPQGRCW